LRLLLRPAAVAASWLLCLGACEPDLPNETTLVARPRVLGVRATPAEVRPRGAVELEALIASPEGPLVTDQLGWSFCRLRRPEAELGPAARGCLEPPGPALPAEAFASLGAGPRVRGAVPSDACRLFGPDNPPPRAGEPPPRPVDPDPTGGYFQPVRLELGGGVELGEVRLRCGLSGATPEQTRLFEGRSRPNENPIIADLLMDAGEGTVRVVPVEQDPAAVTLIPAGRPILLALRWPDCPASTSCGDGVCGLDEDERLCPADCQSPRACGGAEPYLWLDPEQRALVARRESLRVSWFASAGRFQESRTGVPESAAAATTEVRNAFTASANAGDTVWLYTVLRDDRGGGAWASYRLRVR
jgi:hypothetical protein